MGLISITVTFFNCTIKMNESPILKLDDYLLNKIFKYISSSSSLIDICSVSVTCIRFQKLVETIVSHRNPILDYVNEIYRKCNNTNDLALIGQVIGKYICQININLLSIVNEKLCIDHFVGNYVNLIPKYYMNVTKIWIEFISDVDENNYKILQILNNYECYHQHRQLRIQRIYFFEKNVQEIIKNWPLQEHHYREGICDN